jgi:hypothetical protein
MNKLLEKIIYIYNIFGIYSFSNIILCNHADNITLHDNDYLIIDHPGYYYIHIYENIKPVFININKNKTNLNTLNLIKLNNNDIITRYDNDNFNMLICRNDND